MTSSNLAILLFVCAVTLFIASHLSRRKGGGNPKMQIFIKGLTVVTLTLAAVYFFRRFI